LPRPCDPMLGTKKRYEDEDWIILTCECDNLVIASKQFEGRLGEWLVLSGGGRGLIHHVARDLLGQLGLLNGHRFEVETLGDHKHWHAHLYPLNPS